MFIIIECDADGNSDPESSYLNHSCLSTFAFGSQDMAWTGTTDLEAEGMAARIEAKRHDGGCEAPEHYKIMEV
jgi:hypothetical protein